MKRLILSYYEHRCRTDDYRVRHEWQRWFDRSKAQMESLAHHQRTVGEWGWRAAARQADPARWPIELIERVRRESLCLRMSPPGRATYSPSRPGQGRWPRRHDL